jgi:hypothetical protein
MGGLGALARTVVVGAVAVTCAVVLAPSGFAAGTLAVAPICESGQSQFRCTATATGGTAPYTIAWTPEANAFVTRTTGSLVSGTCPRNTTVELLATVTDATGAKASALGVTGCNPGIWP